MDYYVVVVDQDLPVGRRYQNAAPGGPIVWETYLESASLEEAKKLAEMLRVRYGGARIAKLVFVETSSNKEAGK